MSLCLCIYVNLAYNDHDQQNKANVKSIERAKWRAYRNQNNNNNNDDNRFRKKGFSIHGLFPVKFKNIVFIKEDKP